MAGVDPGLAGLSVQETEPDSENSCTLPLRPSTDPSTLNEPWRVFPDADIEVPGDRLDKRGNATEGFGAFRVHSPDTVIIKDGKTEEEKTYCYNDWNWGAIYRHVQSILAVLRNNEIEIWKNSGHHHKGEEPPLVIERVPILPELTLAMGAGNAWVPPTEEEEEERRMKEEAAENGKDDESEVEPGEQFEECAVVEPHDVRDYLSATYPSVCGPMRLLTFQTRECASLRSARTSLLGKEAAYEVWQRAPGTYEIGSPEAAAESMRLRELISGHLFNAEKPILIDDSVNSYLVVGYREFDPEGPHEEAPVQYRILDAQYGLRYSVRPTFNFMFDPEKGSNQLGTDLAKDQWVPAEWLEEGRGCLNSYVPGPMWMVLLIGDAATSPTSIIQVNVAAADAQHEAEEEERKRALHARIEQQAKESADAMAAAKKAAEEEEVGDVEDDAIAVGPI